MTTLSVRDLAFGYGGDMVLSGISMELERPELVCLVGPNGVGKTTLVKCINRLLKPESGTVLLDGRDVQSMSLMEMARKMAFVPNTMSSVFRISVAEAVLMGRFPFSQWVSTDADLDIVDRTLGEMGLQELSDRDINEISSGQLQRVMIARGLVQDPKVLILDEPTSNLDVRSQMEVMGFLRDYARSQGVIVLMVCHDLNITATFADRIVMLSKEGVYADGNASSVMTEGNISHVYGVRSKVIEIEGRPHVILLAGRPDEP